MNNAASQVQGLLLHLNDNSDAIGRAVRILLNARRDLPDWPISLVIQGAAVTAAHRDHAEEAGLHAAFTMDDSEVVVCHNSLTASGIDAADLVPNVIVVPSAVGYLARQQAHGWAYIRI